MNLQTNKIKHTNKKTDIQITNNRYQKGTNGKQTKKTIKQSFKHKTTNNKEHKIYETQITLDKRCIHDCLAILSNNLIKVHRSKSSDPEHKDEKGMTKQVEYISN